MIKAITYDEIVKVLAKFLDDNSGIYPTRILNAASVRGTDISQVISETETYSPEMSNSFLLFELIEDENGEHFVTKGESETDMTTIQSYIFHLMIYGNKSATDAQKISAIFKTSDLVLGLRDEGIYVNGVNPIQSNNEFINNTYLFRKDIDINIQVRYNFENIVEDPEYFESLLGLYVLSK